MAVKICGRKKCKKLFVPYYANKLWDKYGTRVWFGKDRDCRKNKNICTTAPNVTKTIVKLKL